MPMLVPNVSLDTYMDIKKDLTSCCQVFLAGRAGGPSPDSPAVKRTHRVLLMLFLFKMWFDKPFDSEEGFFNIGR